jgi:hypothetical protein
MEEIDFNRDRKQVARAVIIIIVILAVWNGYFWLFGSKITNLDCYKEIMSSTGDMNTFWGLNRTGMVYCTVELTDVCECHFLLGNGEVIFRNYTRDIMKMQG